MSENKKNPWLTGKIFDGHYEIGHLIARGGMAEVYHGVDLWSNNPVAIKVLSPQLSADPSQQQKFFREERSLRQINHDHVVGVIGSGTQDVHGLTLMYIALDYVHGSTLQQLLTLRPVLSVAETLDIIIPAVEGLSEVHAHRFIHRDIKPSNVLLSSLEHSIKLTDFGLTRRTDQSWTGELMGTPAYVAPEIVDPQARVGPGADIFAIGIMMFRMLTGRLPFSGKGDDQEIIYHNVNTEIPSVDQFAPGVDSDLVGVIKWCTRKYASARPADGTELFEVLQSIAERLSPQELAYRAPQVEGPLTDLWDDVERIAERSGATRVLSQTSISGYGKVDDVLEDLDMDEPEIYEPHQISGVGPHLESEQEHYSAAPKKENPAEEDFSDQVFEDATFIEEKGSLRFEPISASYRASDAEHSTTTLPQEKDPAERATTLPAQFNPRLAPHSWQERPAAVTILLISIGIILGFLMAGFLGWQLAQMVLQSAWFAQWNDFLDSFPGGGA